MKLISANYLKSLLKEKNCTLNDLKAEVIIMLFYNFIEHYFIGEDNKKSQLIFESEESREESEYIYTRLKIIKEELEKYNILTIESLQKEISKSLYIAAKLSPYTILYNYAIDVFTKKRKKLFIGNDSKIWIPDAIAIYLIIDAKEYDIDFKNFPILNTDNFDDIIKIYMKNNLELKKLTNEKFNASIIGKTASIANSMIKRILDIR